MGNTQNYCYPDQLKDGTAIVIRAVRPDDRAGFVEAFKKLEDESIPTHFFRFRSELTEKEIQSATEVDFEKTVGLVATIPAAGKEETIIGAGRFVRCDPPQDSVSAELAFTVEEDYRGLGIATRIFSHLLQIARERGLERFEADVRPQNRAMLTVFAHSGLPMVRTLEGDRLHVTLILRPVAP
jgi:RimJ/RimL family protein N-acetyltransferase